MVELSSLVCTCETGWSPCVGCTVDWLMLGGRKAGDRGRWRGEGQLGFLFCGLAGVSVGCWSVEVTGVLRVCLSLSECVLEWGAPFELHQLCPQWGGVARQECHTTPPLLPARPACLLPVWSTWHRYPSLAIRSTCKSIHIYRHKV